MPKRKHSELDDDRDRGDKVNTVKAARLRHKFEHGSQLLFRALKTARGFERQKLGRRQKTAKTDGDEKASERLEKEVHVLKALNLEETAERYLYKQLTKTKRIFESPEFVRLEKSITSSATGPRDPAEANVTARLFKSNPVQNALPDILTDIRGILGINEIAKKQQTAKQKQDVDEDEAVKKADAKSATSDSAIHGKPSNDEQEDDDISMNDVSGDDNDNESLDLDLSQFDARLAPASDSDGEDSSNETNTHYNLADDISISSSEASEGPEASEFSGFSESPPPSEPEESRTTATKSTTTTTTKTTKKSENTDKQSKDTTFLPSLMMGGYWSGSESGEDNDNEIAETAANSKPQRKNRMGQQARRALWEKKYGTKANHIQQQQQQDNKRNKNNRNSGWDVRRGATDESGSHRSQWGQARDGGQFNASNSRERPAPRSHRPNNIAGTTASGSGSGSGAPAAMHPSWEAARKAKEQKAQASFQGKKIVFD